MKEKIIIRKKTKEEIQQISKLTKLRKKNKMKSFLKLKMMVNKKHYIDDEYFKRIYTERNIIFIKCRSRNINR
jgi:hypothetical protein